ncbi:PrpF domain-containing protein [Streptomyces sp. NPDC046203]|uniref:PrpF domain-containing protein n=1 Tax=Streptomyces sp. NPDC046203 TaxID=3154602 RepID=UPI0033C4959A
MLPEPRHPPRGGTDGGGTDGCGTDGCGTEGSVAVADRDGLLAAWDWNADGGAGGTFESGPVGSVTGYVVRADDAPGPTLVLPLDHLPAGALALAGELAGLRRALARTPYRDLNKIAVYGSSAHPGVDLDYRFVQALPDGSFDFRTGCGHSLLACVVADQQIEGRRPGPGPGRRPGPGAGPVTVRALTTGDTIRVLPQGTAGAPLDMPPLDVPPQGTAGAPPAPDGAYTLDFLRPPTAPGTLPTGRPVDVIDGVPVSIVRYGNPYVFVDARHLPPADPPRRARMLQLRAQAASLLGYAPWSPLAPLPKIATFSRTPDGTGLAVRALTVGGWHPRLALTGAAALAAAGALAGTVVPGPVGAVTTPGGPVRVSAAPDRVRVHDKRARPIARLDLPWRIHATA